jgi:hypothetical protein
MLFLLPLPRGRRLAGILRPFFSLRGRSLASGPRPFVAAAAPQALGLADPGLRI